MVKTAIYDALPTAGLDEAQLHAVGYANLEAIGYLDELLSKVPPAEHERLQPLACVAAALTIPYFLQFTDAKWTAEELHAATYKTALALFPELRDVYAAVGWGVPYE